MCIGRPWKVKEEELVRDRVTGGVHVQGKAAASCCLMLYFHTDSHLHFMGSHIQGKEEAIDGRAGRFIHWGGLSWVSE